MWRRDLSFRLSHGSAVPGIGLACSAWPQHPKRRSEQQGAADDGHVPSSTSCASSRARSEVHSSQFSRGMEGAASSKPGSRLRSCCAGPSTLQTGIPWHVVVNGRSSAPSSRPAGRLEATCRSADSIAGFTRSTGASCRPRSGSGRAKGRCEHCDRPHGKTVQHLGDGRWWDEERHTWRNGQRTACGRPARPRQLHRSPYDARGPGDCPSRSRFRRTTRPRNLAALCQRCHILHDGEEHRRRRWLTYRRRRALGDLFTGPYR